MTNSEFPLPSYLRNYILEKDYIIIYYVYVIIVYYYILFYYNIIVNLHKNLDKSNVKFQVKVVWNMNKKPITKIFKTEDSNSPWESSGWCFCFLVPSGKG